jgi:hypothetical protein
VNAAIVFTTFYYVITFVAACAKFMPNFLGLGFSTSTLLVSNFLASEGL